MDKNQKIAVGVIVLIALIAAWQLGKQPAGQNQNENQNSQMQAEDSAEKTETKTTPKDVKMAGEKTSSGEFWEGTLMASDNSKKGNLMLKAADHTIYLRTSRDFSALVGKEVKVSYTGTLDSFTLSNITAK